MRRAALRTSYYSKNYPEMGGLESVRPIHAWELYARHAEFENRRAPAPASAPLATPWIQAGRVAALAPWFPVDAPLVLPQFEPRELAALAPAGNFHSGSGAAPAGAA